MAYFQSIKTFTAGIFVFFWVFYVMLSALEAYGVIVPGV
jgi:hypothetical protein